MFERLNTWLYLNRIYIEMSGNDPAQRESTRDGRRGAARAEGGRAPEAAVFLFSGCPPKAGTGRPRAPAGRAPERRRSSRPPGGPRRASAGPPGLLRLWTGAKRQFRAPFPPRIPPRLPSALPRRSCRHPVCGRVSRPRRGGGAYNTELVAAKGPSPEAMRPAARGTAGENFLKKVLDTAERAR